MQKGSHSSGVNSPAALKPNTGGSARSSFTGISTCPDLPSGPRRGYQSADTFVATCWRTPTVTLASARGSTLLKTVLTSSLVLQNACGRTPNPTQTAYLKSARLTRDFFFPAASAGAAAAGAGVGVGAGAASFVFRGTRMSPPFERDDKTAIAHAGKLATLPRVKCGATT